MKLYLASFDTSVLTWLQPRQRGRQPNLPCDESGYHRGNFNLPPALVSIPLRLYSCSGTDFIRLLRECRNPHTVTFHSKLKMAPKTEWYRDNFLISTQQALIQPTAINKAFESDSMYWAKPMEETLLMKMLDKSICFGLYVLPTSASDIAGSRFVLSMFPPG